MERVKQFVEALPRIQTGNKQLKPMSFIYVIVLFYSSKTRFNKKLIPFFIFYIVFDFVVSSLCRSKPIFILH